jgi:hypothetical protein
LELSDPSLAEVFDKDAIIAKEGGNLTIKFIPEGYPGDSARTSIFIRKPVAISFSNIESTVTAGEVLPFLPKLMDQQSNEIEINDWHFEIENTELLRITKDSGSYYLNVLKPGETKVKVYSRRFPDIAGWLDFKILPSQKKIKVYVTAKTVDDNLLPAQWIEIDPGSVNQYVENRSGDYSNPGFVSLARVAGEILLRAGLSFSFRDDGAAGNQLYLYMVDDNGYFLYGWGGKRDPAAFARAWVTRLNGDNVLKGLDKTVVSNGDSVILYHVNNLLTEWILTGLSSTVTSSDSDNIINLFYWKASCSFDDKGNIIETIPVPYSGQNVQLAGNSAGSLVTDENGRAAIRPASGAPWTIRAGNDAVLVSEGIVTNVNPKPGTALFIFPNPATDYIKVSGSSEVITCTIYDLAGRICVREERLASDGIIFTSHLDSGVYIIEIEHINGVYRQKFVKR